MSKCIAFQIAPSELACCAPGHLPLYWVAMDAKRKPTSRAVSTRTDTGFNVARAAGLRVESYDVGALPLLNWILKRMDLEHFLESYLPPSDPREKVTTPRAVLVLLKNILLAREPVYGMGEWAEQHAPDLLGLARRQIESLNDDRIGRSLDRLFLADYPSLLLALVSHVVKEFEIDLDQVHNDSTTVSFCGKYDDAKPGARKFGKGTLVITWGHNKDHRPDLKQLLFLLTVARDGGVPIHFSPRDGNVEDSTTHRDTWDLLCKMAGCRDFLYVADSKLASAENLAHIHQRGGRFVTVLPRTRREDGEFREKVVDEQVSWREVLTRTKEVGQGKNRKSVVVDLFRVSDDPATSAEGYRLYWYHSSRKQNLDSLRRSEGIERALKGLSELRQRLRSPRTRLKKKESVAEAIEKVLQPAGAHRWIRVEIEEVQQVTFRQSSRGRPGKKTTYRKAVRSRFEITYEVDTVAVARESLTDGVFPLITNDLDLPPRDVLVAYKKQPQVEKRFTHFKTDFEVAPVYLKDAGRIEGLLCAYFLALLIESLLERELRRRMAAAGVRSLPMYPERRACKAPSARRLIDLFDNIQRLVVSENGRLRAKMVTQLSTVQEEILSLLEIRPATYGK